MLVNERSIGYPPENLPPPYVPQPPSTTTYYYWSPPDAIPDPVRLRARGGRAGPGGTGGAAPVCCHTSRTRPHVVADARPASYSVTMR